MYTQRFYLLVILVGLVQCVSTKSTLLSDGVSNEDVSAIKIVFDENINTDAITNPTSEIFIIQKNGITSLSIRKGDESQYFKSDIVKVMKLINTLETKAQENKTSDCYNSPLRPEYVHLQINNEHSIFSYCKKDWDAMNEFVDNLISFSTKIEK